MSLIYLDYAATTPLSPTVLSGMLPYLQGEFGNPSSIYQLGQNARFAVDSARRQVATVLNGDPAEITFTSGSTESNNVALSGVLWAARKRGIERPHLITSAIEHSAVLEHAAWLESVGFAVTYVGCDKVGMVDPAEIAGAITSETSLISIMFANNEVGTIQPLAEIAAIAHDRGIPLHTDATQAAGMMPLDMNALGVDLLSLSAHKFYGPKGIGVLACKRWVSIDWQQHGGGQEGGRRGGTENVAGIVGLGTALTEAESLRPTYLEHCRQTRDLLWDKLRSSLAEIELNGAPLDGPRLSNNLNVQFNGIQGETMLVNLDLADVAASAGSACSVGRNEPSHVLMAMGRSAEESRCALRFTVGRGTSMEELARATDAIVDAAVRAGALAIAPQ